MVVELRRFNNIILQISMYDIDRGKYYVVGTITIDEEDMESRGAWQKAIEAMNIEFSQKSSLRR